MSALASFGQNARAVLFGASGGIGAAVREKLVKDERVGEVYAGARRAAMTTETDYSFRFDLLDESSIAEAAARIGAGGPVDLVVVATGLLHSGSMQPEKTWREFDATAFGRAFAINATGPALIAKHMLPLLASGRKSVFAALSARVGSIEDNRLGGWTSYRASKAALHQIVRTCAIELQRKNRDAVCVALHPGTVDTELSKPFQRGVAPGRLLTPAESAAHLLRVIDSVTPAHSGSAFGWSGERIPF